MSALRDRLSGFRPDTGLVRDVAVALALAVLLFVAGSRGWRSAGESRVRIGELTALLDATRGWTERFVAPTEAERELWMRSEARLADMEVAAAAHLALLERVSESAARAGIPDARIAFAETVQGDSWRNAGAWMAVEAAYGLDLTFTSDYASAAALPALLPAAVELRTLRLTRDPEGAFGVASLAVYESLHEPEPAAAGLRSARPEELSALGAHLLPSSPADSARTASPGGSPAIERDPFRVPRARVAPPPTVASAPRQEPIWSWSLNAIFISERRRVASIDGRIVSVGDTLAGGARVSAIEPDRVVVTDASGRTRILTLE